MIHRPSVGLRAGARGSIIEASGSTATPRAGMIHRVEPASDADREAMPELLAPMLARSGAVSVEDERWAL